MAWLRRKRGGPLYREMLDGAVWLSTLAARCQPSHRRNSPTRRRKSGATWCRACPPTGSSDGGFPILTEYCRLSAGRDCWNPQIAAFEVEWAGISGDIERLDKLLAMADREAKAAVNCARALRLTPHTQLHQRAAARRGRGRASVDALGAGAAGGVAACGSNSDRGRLSYRPPVTCVDGSSLSHL